MSGARSGSPGSSDSDGSRRDRAMLRRAGWRAAVQFAVLVAVTFALCGTLVLVVVDRGQQNSTGNQLAGALAHVDDVADPPAGIYLAIRSPQGAVETTPGAPDVLPDAADLLAVAAAPVTTVRLTERRGADGELFRVRTQHVRGTATVAQAAISLRADDEERGRLLGALTAGALLALVAAAGIGLVAGRRELRELIATMSRQRRFVADASHELRTPLTVLATRAQLLRRHLAAADLPAGERRILNRDADSLVADTSRLADLLEELLVSATPGVGDTDTARLSSLAGDALESMRLPAQNRDVRLVLSVPDGPDGPGGPVEVRAGSAAIHRCLVALLDNAIRHTPEGGAVTVAVAWTRTIGLISVTDTGPGIPRPLRDRLFDRFQHGTEDEDPTGATGKPRRYGLGLALVADTVDRLGGAVDVETSENGTTFTLRLPRVR